MKSCYIHQIDKMYGSEVDLLPTTEENVYLISRVITPKKYRGQGYGSKVMKKVLDDADKEGITLLLYIEPDDGLNEEQLSSWYKRLGFVSVNYMMERKPK